MTKRIVLALALLAVTALGVAIYRFNKADPNRALSGPTRADFVRSAADGCATRQKAAPDNAQVTPATIEKFCGCYAEALAKRVTAADVTRFTGAKPADIQTAMREKMVESETLCLDRLDEDGAADKKP